VCSPHLHQKPVPPSTRRAELAGVLPESLEQVLLACLAKEPGDRPADAAALAAMLLACDVPQWSREDARAWWSQPGTRKKAEARRAKHAQNAREGIETTELGDTVAIALDDRGAA
jgi:hypothetical protein